jgi:tRNA (guanine-N7-)-methyltransferase
MTTTDHHRRIRSFVRRPGRITAAQQRALTELAPRWLIAPEPVALDLPAIFGRDAPRVLEIGFGDGEALYTTAVNHPDIDYLGIEVHEPGIGHLLLLLERAALTNVRIIDRDAVDVIAARVPDGCFDAVNLFFPDPWPKKRHHKRRILQPEFVRELARILKDGGLLHVATDWANYAEHTLEVMAASPAFTAIEAANLCNNALAFRPPTRFERRGRRLGHEVTDVYYRRGHTSGNDAAGTPDTE